ncbi:MAG: hypothetical protein U0531_15645 [Dehalococcoidia bacterium]
MHEQAQHQRDQQPGRDGLKELLDLDLQGIVCRIGAAKALSATCS